MKKNYLLILACICFHFAKATNPVPNASFENWTAGNPDGWGTSNQPSFTSVTQITPGYNSTYAAKGQTALYVNATRSPVLESNGTSANGFIVTQEYNNFEFYYKTKLVLGDVFIASVLIEDSSHSTIGAGVDTISTTDSVYTVMDIGITYLNANAATSAIITFSLLHGAGSGNDTVSYFIVDNVSLDSINTTGLVNVSAESKLIVFPIPAHDWLTIKGQADNSKPFQLILTDALGRVMIEKKLKTPSGNFIDEELNLGSIAAGVYSLILVSNEGVLARKVIIQ